MKLALALIALCTIGVLARHEVSHLERYNNTVEAKCGTWFTQNVYIHGGIQNQIPSSAFRAIVYRASATTVFRNMALKLDVNASSPDGLQKGLVATVLLIQSDLIPQASDINPLLGDVSVTSGDIREFRDPLFKTQYAVIYAETFDLKTNSDTSKHTVHYCLEADILRNNIQMFGGNVLTVLIGFKTVNPIDQNVKVSFTGTNNYLTNFAKDKYFGKH